MRPFVKWLILAAACAVSGCAPSRAPSYTPFEWRTLDNRTASGPKFIQDNQYCHGSAEAGANGSVSLLMYSLSADGAYKACMAKSGYIWVPADQGQHP
jgi:hypothetical protein